MSTSDSVSQKHVRIAIFGPGCGESIVIYSPGLGWGVIDSCLQKIEGRQVNPALEYLQEHDVKKLAFVILTHPHEDHYLGLDQILNHYLGKVERVCYYSGAGVREYRKYLLKKYHLGESGLSSLGKVFKSFDEAKKAGSNIIHISERTEVVRKSVRGSHNIEILALSPSAESVRKYTQILFDAIPVNPGDEFIQVNDKDHNLLSAAIWCSFGNLRIVFGSDLESGRCDDTGWRAVLKNVDSPELSAINLIKVPHHGSPNAYHNEAWCEFSDEKTELFSVVTPYTKLSDPLPRIDILEKICSFSHKVAITAETKTVRPKKVYDRSIVKHLLGVRKWRCLVEPDKCGRVQVDLDISNGNIDNLLTVEPAYIWEGKRT